jgi:hypothetical protein
VRPTYLIATIPTHASSATATVTAAIDVVFLDERLLRGAARRSLVVPSRSMIFPSSPTGCYEEVCPSMRGVAYQMQCWQIPGFRILGRATRARQAGGAASRSRVNSLLPDEAIDRGPCPVDAGHAGFAG